MSRSTEQRVEDGDQCLSGATGPFMCHCHVLEHEDESVMRPFVVLPPEVMAVDPHTGGGGHDHGTSS